MTPSLLLSVIDDTSGSRLTGILELGSMFEERNLRSRQRRFWRAHQPWKYWLPLANSTTQIGLEAY